MKIPMKAVAMVVAVAFFCVNISWAAGGDFRGMSLRKQSGYVNERKEETVKKNGISNKSLLKNIAFFLLGSGFILGGGALPSAQAFIGGSERKPVLLAAISDFEKDNVPGSFAKNAGRLENEKVTEARQEFQEVWQELLPQVSQILTAYKDGRKEVVAEKLIIEPAFSELVSEADKKYQSYLTALKYYSGIDFKETTAIGKILEELTRRVEALHSDEELLQVYEDDWTKSMWKESVLSALLVTGFLGVFFLLALFLRGFHIKNAIILGVEIFIGMFFISALGGMVYYGWWSTRIRYPAQTRVYKANEAEISRIIEHLKRLNRPGLLSAYMKVSGLSMVPMDSYQRPLYAEALLSSI